MRFLAKAKDGEPSYKDFSNLKGKNINTTAGSTSERLIKAMSADEALGMIVIGAKDHREAFNFLEGGRAVAFICNNVLLKGQKARARKPADWVVTGTSQSTEYCGFGMRRHDAPFKKAVDDAMASYFKADHGKKSYEK